MKYSTGRNTGTKHSTLTKGDRAQRRKDRHPQPKHSTGQESAINHSTGAGYDAKRDEQRARAEAEQAAFEEATKREPPKPV